MEGVVVCIEHETMVRQAWVESEQRSAVRAEKRRMDKISHAWRKIVRGSIIRMKILQTKGKDGQMLIPTSGGSAEGTVGGNSRGAAAMGASASVSLSAMPYGSVAIAGGAMQNHTSSTAAGSRHDHEFTSKRFDERTNAWINHCACGAEPAEEI